jgi:ribosome recycling factor
VRREGIDVVKKQKNDKEISEDDLFKFQDAVQAETDKHVKQIDEITDNKETEMMEV